ncbi:MAG: type II toxin-antitoxin system HipA family toxin [Bradymonadia bacterium]
MTRSHTLLDDAQQRGASAGLATGAGGEAPKLLLRVDGDEVWIDTLQEHDEPGAHVLVKFPRRTGRVRMSGQAKDTEVDRLVLVTESVYYRALAALGISTIDVSRMHLRMTHDERPSLWMPRFDVEERNGETMRFGMESLYALTDTPPGAHKPHQAYLDALHRVLIEGLPLTSVDPARPHTSGPRSAELVSEYIQRDLLNVIFGNSDNHGRNTSILKTPEEAWLAPIYDFAPMVIDPAGIIRSTRWGQLERGANDIDWRGVCAQQTHLVDPEEIWADLRALAERLIDLDERLESLGLPDEALNHPQLKLRQVNQRLRRWDLVAA